MFVWSTQSTRWIKSLLCLFVFATLSLWPATGRAQGSSKGNIEGTVEDAGGAAVPGAEVTIPALKIRTVSDAQGTFRVPELAPGKYNVGVNYVGFSPLTSEVEVKSGETTSVTLQLKVANASEQILVEASRPHGERRRSMRCAPLTIC